MFAEFPVHGSQNRSSHARVPSRPNKSRACNFKELEDPVSSIHMGWRVHRNSKWIAPPLGKTKRNVDGAVCSTRGKSAVVVLFRDHAGIYQGGSVLFTEGVTDPACVEAMACREVLFLSQDLHINSAVIACDSSMVVKDISEGTQGANSMIIAEIRKLVPTLIFLFLLNVEILKWMPTI